MSTHPGLTHKEEDITFDRNLSLSYCYNNNRYPKHVLKPKNIFKSNSKCSKALKRKLKKYKLRKDGKEDQDIVDVSKTLLSTLKIVSPRKTSQNTCDISEDDFERPRHYLYKMARRKMKTKSDSKDAAQTVEPNDNIPLEQNSKQTSPVKTTEEKKHTNAFKLMMGARNKSIGANSPGKELDKSISESPEVIDKKNLKVKRNLALQKMAEAKGSTKKKEMEDFQEECIKRKMDERAKRLKSMLTKAGKLKQIEIQPVGKSNEIKSINQEDKPKDKFSNTDSISDQEISKNPAKTLTLVSIFDDETTSDIKPKKKVLKEDVEFLKKLSPSIKKKENMLCYFKKVDKEPEDNIEIVDNEDENTSSIIKVKMTPKNKKKLKSKKLQHKKRVCSEILKDHNELSTDVENKTVAEVVAVDHTSNNTDRRKRKRNNDIDDNKITNLPSEEAVDLNSDGRPKRHVKKPIKYVDDVQLSSSDDELLIFTPKKRRQTDSKKDNAKSKSGITLNISKDELLGSTVEVTNKKTNLNSKKPTKLAPIFATKPQLSQEELEAKQKFLQSGIPEQLKKIITKQKKNDFDNANNFLPVVHVQQIESIELSTSNSLNDSNDEFEEEILIKDNITFSKLLNNTKDLKVSAPAYQKTQVVLQSIKENFPKFPVYRTYRLLKSKSRGECNDSICPDLENSVEILNCMNDSLYESPDKLSWTEKYKPTLCSHIIGNFDSIRELKKWLISWTENDNKIKHTSAGSDSSDFCYSDTDSRDNMKYMNNLLVLTGPAGSGKTSSVYAVAAELAIKVIEVNASSKRTGKMMIQDLQEATQSHKVNRGNSCTENSQKSQETKSKFALKTYKKRGRPKKGAEEIKNKDMDKTENLSQQSKSQEKTRTGMSLILIDDADIVFEQDDGFASAVSQLISSSKRPVILVTSSLMCPHLQKFIQYGKSIKLRPLLPKILGTWLDIMCLAENGLGWHGLGEKFLNYFKGDIRKTINYLQFCLVTHTRSSMHEDSSQQNSESYKPHLEDEASSMSWADQADSQNLEQNGTEISVGSSEEAWKYFMNSQLNIESSCLSFALFNSWWSIPTIFDELYSKNVSVPHEKAKEKDIKELDSVAKMLDNFSMADSLSCVGLHNRIVVTSQPWKAFEADSVSELEDPNNYDKHFEINNEIVHDLILRSVNNCQKTLGIEEKTDLEFPGMDVERTRKHITSLHDGVTKCLNPSVTLDRRSLALDYWAGCRTISRIEKTKVDVVCKRNNRFCHYLKSLNIFCKNDSYDNLANSLASDLL